MKTSFTANALNLVYGPSASNFALTVLARQVAFYMESRGFTTVTSKQPEKPAFDEALDIGVPLLDGHKEKPAFDMDAAATAYACCLTLAADALNRPLEYGRKPNAESLARYFSQPSDWLQRKIEYWTPRFKADAEKTGTTFGASVEAIAGNAAAKLAEYVAHTTTIAKTMAGSIKVASREIKNTDREEIVVTLFDKLAIMGVSPDEETRSAGEAMLRIKKQQFERKEKVSTPQPGVLKYFSDLGIKV